MKTFYAIQVGKLPSQLCCGCLVNEGSLTDSFLLLILTFCSKFPLQKCAVLDWLQIARSSYDKHARDLQSQRCSPVDLAQAGSSNWLLGQPGKDRAAGLPKCPGHCSLSLSRHTSHLVAGECLET